MPTALSAENRAFSGAVVSLLRIVLHAISSHGSAKTVPNSLALTDAGIRRLVPPSTGTLTFWDTMQKGLGVRVSPKGTRTFIALVGSGARHKIGRYPAISLAVAREETRKLLAKRTLGTYEKPHTITWDTAVERYLAACGEKNRPRTIADYRKHLDRFPFAGRRLTNLKKRDVSAAEVID